MEKIENQEQIERKLIKALKLQESAIKLGNEKEAAAAAAAVQRILFKYNLDINDLDLTEKEESKLIEDNGLSVSRYKSIGGKWEKKLLSVLAENNLCTAFWYSRTNKATVIGRKGNVKVVVWLYEVLSARFVELGKDRYSEYLHGVNSEDVFLKFLAGEEYNIERKEKPIGIETFLRRYLVGCSYGLQDKYYEEEKERQRQKEKDIDFSKVTSIVLASKQEVDLYVKEKYKSMKTVNIKVKSDKAFWAGVKDGKNTQLNKAVSCDDGFGKKNVLG